MGEYRHSAAKPPMWSRVSLPTQNDDTRPCMANEKYGHNKSTLESLARQRYAYVLNKKIFFVKLIVKVTIKVTMTFTIKKRVIHLYFF